eukprot:Nitzschia sp. Nitz4//scaffold72_size95085//41994//42283//NITZ4_004757-RA/size95085-exonerate_est2genome-gene-0.133-mRNA-1//1//CDS//3329557366//4968//frame0
MKFDICNIWFALVAAPAGGLGGLLLVVVLVLGCVACCCCCLVGISDNSGLGVLEELNQRPESLILNPNTSIRIFQLVFGGGEVVKP